jgi:DNA-binding GntR family transcriptional regulator
MSDRGKKAIDAAAERLRAMSLGSEADSLLGSEDSLITQLGFSRTTVRQVARLLEREGLLKVRRGPNGGYFAARPDAQTIHSSVSAYLETLDMDPEDITIIASALWVEVVRKATQNRTDEGRLILATLKKRVSSLKPDATFAQVRVLEREIQTAILKLATSRYIELIFDINIAFSARMLLIAAEEDDTPDHLQFVRSWCRAKSLELDAIAEGDQDVATLAAQHVRKIWHKRVWLHRRKTPGWAET